MLDLYLDYQMSHSIPHFHQNLSLLAICWISHHLLWILLLYNHHPLFDERRLLVPRKPLQTFYSTLHSHWNLSLLTIYQIYQKKKNSFFQPVCSLYQQSYQHTLPCLYPPLHRENNFSCVYIYLYPRISLTF